MKWVFYGNMICTNYDFVLSIKGLYMFSPTNNDDDWEIDPNGLYVATRSFLIRRGYCCANQCRNCPYINWRNAPTWQPGPAEAVQFAQVSPKVLEGTRARLAYHEEQLGASETGEDAYHRAMIEHYHLLLERWGA